ncbi:MAG: SRPBCC domain-containing protein [Myxococcales bacterium]|nr:SRPBCC domain-containing protein [Myxococcales bacterium]
MSQAIHHAIDIDASLDAVWRVFTDLSTWPRWFPHAVAAQALHDAPWYRRGGGVEVELTVPVLGSMVLRLDIEEADPRHKVRWVGKAWGVRGDHSYTFEDRGAWTRVTSHEQFGGPLAVLANGSAVRERIDRIAHDAMTRLKEVVEAAEVTP